MKITRITVWHLALPLTEPYTLSGGRLRFTELDSTFVRIDTDAGISGWGEGCPWGHTYLPAHGPGIRAGIATLAPALLGTDPRSVDAVNRRMDEQLPGHLATKAPLDIACWDILGKVAGLPLWQLFGGETAATVHINSSIGTDSVEAMVAHLEACRAQGYRTHSVKLGGSDPAADIVRIEAITAAQRPGEYVTYDINRAWTPGIALQVLNTVSARGWVEQPCETLAQCLQVARAVPQPILLDECLHSWDDHLRAGISGVIAGMKLKPNRVGGLTRARQLRDLGLEFGWQMHIEDVGGTALADTAAFHLAASTPEAFRLDSWLGHKHLARDPVPRQGVRNDDGTATVPTTPGLGMTPDPMMLGAPVAVYQ